MVGKKPSPKERSQNNEARKLFKRPSFEAFPARHVARPNAKAAQAVMEG